MEYIVAYNTFSGLAWLLILLTSLKNISNWEFSYNSTFQIALITIVQTAAVAEIVHAYKKLVKSNPVHTVVQVLSRLFVTWGVCVSLLKIQLKGSKVYFLMVLCWSLAEIVRFAYYSYTSRKMKAHPLVVWCRYNFFIALYPLGALCEFLLVQRSVKYLPSNSRILKLLYYTIMILYGPLFGFLYIKMLEQRSKHIKKT